MGGTGLNSLLVTGAKNGYCLHPTCNSKVEDIDHILLWCPSYNQLREKLLQIWLSCSNHSINQLIRSILSGPSKQLLLFILDATAHPSVIQNTCKSDSELLKIIFHLTRTWCFCIHKARAKLLNRWPWMDFLLFHCYRHLGSITQIPVTSMKQGDISVI